MLAAPTGVTKEMQAAGDLTERVLFDAHRRQHMAARLFRHSVSLLFISLILGNVVFLLGGYYAPHAALGLWLLVHTGLTVARLFFIHHVNHATARGVLVTRWQLVLHVVGTALAAGVWSSLLVVLGPDTPGPVQVGVLGLLALLTLAGTVAYTESPPVFLAWVTPLWVAIGAWLLGNAQADAVWLGLAVPLIAVAQAYLYSTLWRRADAAERLRIEHKRTLGELREAQHALRHEAQMREASSAALARERRVFEGGPLIAVRTRARAGWPIERVSDNVKQLGYQPEQLVGKRLASLIHPEDLPFVRAAGFVSAADASSPDAHCEYRLKSAEDGYRWVFDYTIPEYDELGVLRYLDTYLIDVSRHYAAHEALRKENERLETTLDSIGDAVIAVNNFGRIDFMNAVAQQITGWPFSQARYSRLSDVFVIRDEPDGPRIDDPVAHFVTEGSARQSRHLQAELDARDGRRYLITYNVAPIYNHAGEVSGHVLIFIDVTEKVRMQRELEYQARHDTLTGMFNRREFETQLVELARRAQQLGERHVLMYLDLDQFKLVNDTGGHNAGDHLLRSIAQRLRGALRSTDVLARLGGDEFGVLLRNCSIDQGKLVGKNLLRAVREHAFVWGERSFEVGVSIGMVPVVHGCGSVETLLTQADIACFAAKSLGRNRLRIYQDSDAEIRQRKLEMDWATRITRSIEAGAFHLYYQEIVPVGDAQPAHGRHLEVLLRMRGDNGEVLLPEAFLASAERHNLMPLLDRWVIREAFRWYASAAPAGETLIAINLSGSSIQSEGFTAYVKGLFRDHAIPPSRVCFEITETAAIENLQATAQFMQDLRGLGCRFALDDFGSGLSAFTYLKTLPVDYLKINGRFVQRMLRDEVDRAMVGAINDLGHTMRLRTIAEQVESDEILGLLAKLDVDLAQGFALSYPQPLSQWRQPERRAVH